MIEPSLTSAIRSLVPDAQFAHRGSYGSIEWHDERQKPSQPDVEAELARQQAEYEATEYRRLRAPEYPPVTDLADAIFWQQQGDDSKMVAYVAACEAVKAKYPKPSDI